MGLRLKKERLRFAWEGCTASNRLGRAASITTAPQHSRTTPELQQQALCGRTHGAAGRSGSSSGGGGDGQGEGLLAEDGCVGLNQGFLGVGSLRAYRPWQAWNAVGWTDDQCALHRPGLRLRCTVVGIPASQGASCPACPGSPPPGAASIGRCPLNWPHPHLQCGERGNASIDDPMSCTGVPSQVASQWGCRPPLCALIGQPPHLPPRSAPTLHPSTHPPAPRTACCPSAAARRRSRHPPSAQPRSGQPGCRAGATRMVRVVRRPPVTATQQLHQTCAAS